MRIAVVGATGRLGGAIARAAADRGHEVAALGSADVDVTDPAAVSKVVGGYDAVAVSVKGPDRLVQRAAQALLDARVARFVMVGGAGSLLGPDGQRLVDRQQVPAAIQQASRDQAEALAILRESGTDLAWSYLSPPPVRLVDQPATGAYRAEERDTPLLAPGSDATFAVGDLAAAAVDALEQGTFVRARFTVGPA